MTRFNRGTNAVQMSPKRTRICRAGWFAAIVHLLCSGDVLADAPPAVASASVQAMQTEARKLSDLYVYLAEKVSVSVVQIEVTVRDDSSETGARRFDRAGVDDSPVARGTGSGVIFTRDGAIVTNNHVIDEALSINVKLRDGRFLPARLVGRDPGTDLAVIKVEASGLVPASFADSDAVRVGELVVAVGSPFGLDYTVTTGNLSAKGRGSLGVNPVEDYLQTSAGITYGSSGGPLCNLEARVIGINTMIVDKANAIGFAVPANIARRVAEQILKMGKVQRAWIGVGVQKITPELAGAMKLELRTGGLVNAITENGPAGRANIRPGDVITSVGGKPIRDGGDVTREIMMHDVGETIALEVLRQGNLYAATVNLVARPEPAVPPIPMQQRAPPNSGLGMSVRELTPTQAVQLGLSSKPLPVIALVHPGSAADRAGLQTGDVIVEADGILEPTASQLQQAGNDGQLLLRVRRKEAAFYAVVKN